MTSRGGTSITWNVENRVTGVGTDAYVYDGDGKRVKKTEGGSTIHYVNRYYEKNITTSEVTTYYYHGDRLVALRKGTALEYVHQDHLTGTAVSTDSAGATKSTIKYLPYGATRSSSGTLGTDKKFTGQRLDGTGLYFYNARYYDPGIGRFVSPDNRIPGTQNPQGLNRYSYVVNNPLTYTDPSGECWGRAKRWCDRAKDVVVDKAKDVGKKAAQVATEVAEVSTQVAYPVVERIVEPVTNAIAQSFETAIEHTVDAFETAGQRIQQVANAAEPWVLQNPTNLVNDALALGIAVVSGGDWDVRDGAIVVENVGGLAGGFLDLVGERAFTVGHFIFSEGLLPEDSQLYAHERNHVDQYRILGGSYLPTYTVNQAIAETISVVTGENPDQYNIFEIWAGSQY